MTNETKVVEQRIIQRLINTIADYEEGGKFYSQVIPLHTQAYAIYDSQAKSGLYYVFGDGVHTYTEIRDGQSSLESAHEYAVFDDAWIELINSKADLQYMNFELAKRQYISNLVNEITEENEKSTTLYPSVKAVTTLTDALQDNIGQEITNRQNADNNLSDAISQEEAKRAEKDTELTQDISREITARQNADIALNVSIEEESSRAINKEDQIIADYTAADSTLSTNINTLRDDLVAENTRAVDAEENLDDIKANKADVYTKTEIDAKLTAAMHFKGTKPTYNALPSSGNTVGDVWNILDTGENYAWDGENWDKLSETLDLSPYALTSDVDAKIATEKNRREDADTELNSLIQGEKTRAEGIEAGLEANKADKSELPTKTSELINDSDFTTNEALQAQVATLTQQIKDLKLLIPTEVTDSSTARSAMTKSGKVTLVDDIDLGVLNISGGMFASNDTTINLNGYEIKAGPTSGRAMLLARGTAKYTFNGKGQFIDTASDSSPIWCASENSSITINNGTFIAQGHTETLYCELGTININGGIFKTDMEDKRYLLNCKDTNFAAGTAKIIVKGGEFWDFDPSANPEGPDTSYVAEGYTVTSREEDGHTVYTVVKA